MKNISSQDYRNCYCRKDPGKWRWGADQEYQKMKKCTVNQGKNTYFQWFSTPKTWQYVEKFRNRHCGSGQKSGNIFFQMCNILISSGIIGSTFIDYFADWFRQTALKFFSAHLFRWFTGEHKGKNTSERIDIDSVCRCLVIQNLRCSIGIGTCYGSDHMMAPLFFSGNIKVYQFHSYIPA